MARGDRDEGKRDRLLRALQQGMGMYAAARAVGISARTGYTWCEQDVELACAASLGGPPIPGTPGGPEAVRIGPLSPVDEARRQRVLDELEEIVGDPLMAAQKGADVRIKAAEVILRTIATARVVSVPQAPAAQPGPAPGPSAPTPAPTDAQIAARYGFREVS